MIPPSSALTRPREETVYRLRHIATEVVLETPFTSMTGATLSLLASSPLTFDQYEIVPDQQ
jgi:hypothetical protein